MEKAVVIITWKTGQKNKKNMIKIYEFLYPLFGESITIVKDNEYFTSYQVDLIRTYNDSYFDLMKGSGSIKNKVRAVEIVEFNKLP